MPAPAKHTAIAQQRDGRPPRQRVDPADYAQAYRERSVEILAGISVEAVTELIEILAAALKDGRQVFICGNGGSAATASHFAAGLGKDGSAGRDKKFRVLSLTDNLPWITSLANDHDYSQIFVEQLKNFGQSGDVLIAFSGSGNSGNILRAIEWAHANGLLTVGITGRTGGRLGQLVRHAIFVDSTHMGHIEEAHFLLQHLVSYYFEEAE
ncbi:MAG: sugar isomerase [Deltaproteobacteria bacterium]|jgi:D-sedoheptulose 7-phosphate isomerase|nr:sugar isomerase [Deltaproteobacteria bacterium]